MLIYSSDGKSIIEANHLHIQKNLGGKINEKFAIVAQEQLVNVALFPDEKTAIDALEKVFTAFENGAKSYKF